MAETYDFQTVERTWQERWEREETYRAADDDPREKCYVLVMLPYPSGDLHVGHVKNYTLGDAIARMMRMRGFNVLNPMGWDAFGLPAENAARERGIHPAKWTRENIAAMRAKLLRMGLGTDGYETIDAPSGKRGLELLAEKPDIIILDLVWVWTI